jgi:hypothetical protein
VLHDPGGEEREKMSRLAAAATLAGLCMHVRRLGKERRKQPNQRPQLMCDERTEEKESAVRKKRNGGPPTIHYMRVGGRKKLKQKWGSARGGEPGRRFPWVFFLFNFEIHFLFLITDYIYIPKIQNKNFNIISISKIHIFFQKNNCSSP